MMQRLLLPKVVVTTFLFFVVTYGSAQAQTSTQPPAPSGAPAQPVTTMPPLQDVTPQPATTSQNSENAVVLLSRVQMIVDDAMSGKPKPKVERPLGDSGLRKSGQVMIDRADLDEIRAAVDQLKTVLQTYNPTPSAQPAPQ
jgi:hypothetical protein